MTIPASCLVPVGIARGSVGAAVATLQEWLVLHGHRVAVDGDFGPATEAALVAYSERRVVDATIAADLVAPMLRATTATGSIVDIARAHLAEHPREVGGNNRGPWVRLYARAEGAGVLWCGYAAHYWAMQAGLVTAELVSPSCDITAARARAVGRLSSVPTIGGLFLVRRNPGDWTHMGVVTGIGDGWVATIEGNTNDDGGREGYEVCARTRGVARLDFVRM